MRRLVAGLGYLFALLALVLTAPASGGEPSSAPAPYTILFVGNSLTSANDLPGVLRSFAAAPPFGIPVKVFSTLPGGATLAIHWQRGEALRLLRNHSPDFLVLQGQSVEPILSPDDFGRHAALFKAEADRRRVKTVLLSSWARPASDPFYGHPPSGGSPAEMQRRLNVAYADLAKRLGTFLAPVGTAWEIAARDAKSIPLLDGSQHPSPEGTYLAAAVLFRTLFRISPEGGTFHAGLPAAKALLLQRIAAGAGPRGDEPR